MTDEPNGNFFHFQYETVYCQAVAHCTALVSSLESRSSVKVDWRESPGAKIVAVEELFVSIFALFIIISNIDIHSFLLFVATNSRN